MWLLSPHSFTCGTSRSNCSMSTSYIRPSLWCNHTLPPQIIVYVCKINKLYSYRLPPPHNYTVFIILYHVLSVPCSVLPTHILATLGAIPSVYGTMFIFIEQTIILVVIALSSWWLPNHPCSLLYIYIFSLSLSFRPTMHISYYHIHHVMSNQIKKFNSHVHYHIILLVHCTVWYSYVVFIIIITHHFFTP